MTIEASFAAAVAAIQPVGKGQTADAGTYTYSYAGLPEVMAEVRRVCALHGIVVVQNLGHEADDHGDYLTCATIVYGLEDGATLTWDPLRCKVPADPQKMGSAATYLRRYALTALFAIATPDDDGRTAAVGIVDEAAAMSAAADAANALYERLKGLNVSQQGRVKDEAKNRGRKLTKAALLDDEWRAELTELLAFIEG